MDYVWKTIRGLSVKTERHRRWFVLYRPIFQKVSESECLIWLHWDFGIDKSVRLPISMDDALEMMNKNDEAIIDIVLDNMQKHPFENINKVPMIFH